MEECGGVEMQKQLKEVELHSRPHCFSCDRVCEFSTQAKHKSESEERSKSAKKLGGLIIFCLIFVMVEIVGGIKSNSLAVLTDAAHLLTDVVGFCISLFAVWASGWNATRNHSFGFSRVEVLGALFSVQLIWLIVGFIIYEAVDRILNRRVPVDGKLMFVTAASGFLMNVVMVTWLGHDHGHGHHSCGGKEHSHKKEEADTVTREERINLVSSPPVTWLRHDHGHHSCGIKEHNHIREEEDGVSQEEKISLVSSPHCEHHCEIESPLPVTEFRHTHTNMNLQGAYLHVVGDLIQSIGVMIGGAIVWARPNWLIVDLICTLVFSALVLLTTVSMARNIFAILMESTPQGIDVERLETGIRSIAGVYDVHDLHVWSMSAGKVLLSCHVHVDSGVHSNDVLFMIKEHCGNIYGIQHVTIQIEQE
ncbi:hypothetical protein GIB67_007739 [Kingdonia uniflora]|uniref:Uncharacterized protein n=1 Tax=Kingdonia uniflora TaxID=39325 RepID=A0A7J7N2F4_9MAGN|nr:hypothetical protein GIB67_007739 [Kingdonia uniflora]